MKINDITLGKVYRTNHHQYKLALEIGKFSIEYGVRKRRLKWNMIDVEVHNWYTVDHSEKTRKVVVFDIFDENFQVLSAAHFANEASEAEVKKLYIDSAVQRTEYERSNKARQRSGSYRDGLTSIVKTIVGNDRLPENTRYDRSPYEQLLNSTVLPKMVLLWLQYQAQRGDDLHKGVDIESLIVDYKDLYKGWEESLTAQNGTDTAIRAETTQHVESKWQGFTLPTVEIAPLPTVVV